jgi:hypothetical protein
VSGTQTLLGMELEMETLMRLSHVGWLALPVVLAGCGGDHTGRRVGG